MFKLSQAEKLRIIERSRPGSQPDTVTIPRAWLDLLPDALSADGRTEEALQALEMKEKGE